MNKELPSSRKVLSTFRTYCPDGVQSAQTIVHFAHFQVQARTRIAARHDVAASIQAVKFIYTSTFHWGLKVAIHCCVTVPMHAIKFLNTSAFHFALKIATLCCRQMYLP